MTKQNKAARQKAKSEAVTKPSHRLWDIGHLRNCGHLFYLARDRPWGESGPAGNA